MRTGLALTAVIALSGLVSLVCTSELATQTAITEATNEARYGTYLAEAPARNATRTAEADGKFATRAAARKATAIANIATSRAINATFIAKAPARNATATAKAPARNATATARTEARAATDRARARARATVTALKIAIRTKVAEWNRVSEIIWQQVENGKITITQAYEYEREVAEQYDNARKAIEAVEAEIEAEIPR